MSKTCLSKNRRNSREKSVSAGAPTQGRQFCAAKIIPYYVQEGEFYIVLGLDAKWKEWSALGGSCHIHKNTQQEYTSQMIIECLQRELVEESKELFSLNQFDLSLKSQSVLTPYRWGDSMTHHYFAQWHHPLSELQDVIETFRSPLYNQTFLHNLITRKLHPKVYYEMADLQIISVSSQILLDMINNTLRDFQLREAYHKKLDPVYYRWLAQCFHRFFQSSIVPTNTTQCLDPRFLASLIVILERHYQCSYQQIGELVKDWNKFLRTAQCVSPEIKQ